MRSHVFLSLALFATALVLPANLGAEPTNNPFAQGPSDTESTVTVGVETGSADAEIELDIEAVYAWAAEGSRCVLSPDLLHAVAIAASSNGLSGGSTYDRAATSQPAIFGATGDGQMAGLALLLDTDDGVIDADENFDRPVGPFQFLPTSWQRYGYDANQDGIADPQNLWDASASAANFLCEMGAGTGDDQSQAILNYAGSQTLADRIVDLYAARRAFSQSRITTSPPRVESTNTEPTSSDSSEDSIAERARGELVVFSPDEFSELEDIDVVSATSLLDPAIEPRAALANGQANGRAALNESGDPFLFPFGTDAQTIAWGDWDADGVADAAFVGNGIRLQHNGLFRDQDGGDLSYSGDWDGDGIETPLIIYRDTDDDNLAVFVPVDEFGLPYGAQVRLANAAEATPLVGDWNGDGRDSIALRVAGEEGVDMIEFFDRFGLSEISPLEVDSDSVALVVPNGVHLSTEEEVAEVEMVTRETAMLETVENGEDLSLVRVGGIVVAESIAEDVQALLEAAEADGLALQGWGWRSHERQIELRLANCGDVFETPSSQCSPPTARPGHSRHEFGLAIDFHIEGRAISAGTDVFAWLTENAHRFGLFNLPSEPWHWSVDGH